MTIIKLALSTITGAVQSCLVIIEGKSIFPTMKLCLQTCFTSYSIWGPIQYIFILTNIKFIDIKKKIENIYVMGGGRFPK